MRNVIRILATALLAAPSTHALGADINRRIIAELDPVAPGSAAYEQESSGIATSKWGGLVDFNMGSVLSTGPELWTGTFAARGDAADPYRREDLWPGERHKLDAIRLRWTVTRWEQAQSMRGWFLKTGYSYTRINSRANRYDETGGEGDAVPVVVSTSTPDDDTDLVTDLRHGIIAGFGNRWLMVDQKIALSVGATFTHNFKRTVTVDAKDDDALADYEDMIAKLPDTRMSVRPTPEVNLGVGFAW